MHTFIKIGFIFMFCCLFSHLLYHAKLFNLQTTIASILSKKNNIKSDENTFQTEQLEQIVIYVIMPTYYRMTQMPELINKCNAFMNVSNLHWILIEDANSTFESIKTYLKSCPVKSTYIFSPSPPKPYKNIKGSNQRNRGLEWLRSNLVAGVDRGVVYFADDDNTYDKQIFSEMRTLKRGATWPVGTVGGTSWEGCMTEASNPNKITKFWAHYAPKREFPIDMAAFAVNLDLIFQFPDAKFDYYKVQQQESVILKGLGFKNAYELEPKANGCSQILVWHTKAVDPKFPVKYVNQPDIFDSIFLK